MASLPDFELFINGQKFTHFTRGFVRLSLEQAASLFEFSYADLRVDLTGPPPIEAGDRCTIKLQDRLLVTGFIDDVSTQYSAGELQLTARGRSTLGDLVDCSAHFKKGRWRDVTLRQIAQNLCSPFGIEVSVDPVGDYKKRFPRFAIDPGESVLDCITRAARLRGLFPASDPEGALRLLAAGERVLSNVALEYGQNIIRGERLDSHAGRHSAYFIKGQSPSDNESNGRTTAQENSAIFDDQIVRYRPLLLVSTSQKGKRDLKRRAVWERNRRAGQGERVIYTVDGFGYGEGFNREVWMPGVQVRIKDPRLAVDGTFLLIACAYRFAADGNEGGRTTDLTFVQKAAFDLIETYPKRKRGRPLGDTSAPTLDEKTAQDRQHADWNVVPPEGPLL